ncbi:hypothetical protein ACLQ3C_18495 [Gordonia sp. DT30]|uniref:hypothetical protein n=1 Tax=unclassified Gordonia (in: high G+C Gram-positive bacteria) TaxID=2657482 RepID=UPI003CE839AE
MRTSVPSRAPRLSNRAQRRHRMVTGRLLVGLVASVSAVSALSACSSSTPSSAPGTSSFPTSASVSVPPGAPPRTSPGAALAFGGSAVLPADAFAPNGPTAMYTVTGITPGEGVPDSATQGGKAYFIYVTVTSLAARPAPAPKVVGLAGSVDGKTPALTLPPPVSLAACANPSPPETMKRGDAYATCLVAYADSEQKLGSVIYWADTTTADGFDFKASPVVWGTPAPPTSSGAPSSVRPSGA